MKRVLVLTLLLLSGPAYPEDRKVKLEISVPAESELGREVIQMYQTLFKKYDYQFSALEYPPVRGLEELKKGRIDGTVGRTSNLAEIFGLKNYVRVDEPLMFLTFSMWCLRPPAELAKQKSISLGYYRGSVVSSRIVEKADKALVNPVVVNTYKIALSMIKKSRLDCIIGSEAVMDSESSSLEGLEGYYRHNIITSAVYPWISTRLQHLKNPLEKDLATWRFSEQWEKRFRYQKATCRSEYDWLCPDGLIFKTGEAMK